jgi:ribosomal protein S15P/S13E
MVKETSYPKTLETKVYKEKKGSNDVVVNENQMAGLLKHLTDKPKEHHSKSNVINVDSR